MQWTPASRKFVSRNNRGTQHVLLVAASTYLLTDRESRLAGILAGRLDSSPCAYVTGLGSGIGTSVTA
jgi:hypothetical protein